MEKCDAEKVIHIHHQHKSAWFSFLKSIASFKGDLSTLTAPPFLLSPQSIIEFSTYWCNSPSLFIAPALEPSAEKRALLVLKWFLSTLKHQHSNRDEDGKKKKMKPLNPFLGEIFKGEWNDSKVGKTKMVAEQVSHHPPVTAFHVWNEKHGIRLQGNVAPHVFWKGTVNIVRKGYSLLHIDAFDEDYLITLPPVFIEGLMTGSLAPELSGTSYIRSSAGYTAEIQYSYKGWLRGKRNYFNATLSRDGEEGTPLCLLEGAWSGEYTIKDLRMGNVHEKVDIGKIRKSEFTVKLMEEQDDMESRKAWRHVAAAIENGDMFTIGKEKSRIENQQRELRKKERAEGVEFQRRYFSRTETSEVAEKLMDGLVSVPGFQRDVFSSHEEGLWVWDQKKYCAIIEMEGAGSLRAASFDSGVGLDTLSVG